MKRRVTIAVALTAALTWSACGDESAVVVRDAGGDANQSMSDAASRDAVVSADALVDAPVDAQVDRDAAFDPLALGMGNGPAPTLPAAAGVGWSTASLVAEAPPDTPGVGFVEASINEPGDALISWQQASPFAAWVRVLPANRPWNAVETGPESDAYGQMGAIADDGRLLLAGDSEAPPHLDRIIANERSAAGVWAATRELSAADATRVASHDLVMLPSGAATVTWTQSNSAAYASRDASGSWSATQPLVSLSGNAGFPTVKLAWHRASGSVEVFYENPDGSVRNRVLAPDGVFGSERTIRDAANVGPLGLFTMALGANGHAAGAWRRPDGLGSRGLMTLRAPGGAGTWTPLSAFSGAGRLYVYGSVALGDAGRGAVVWLEKELTDQYAAVGKCWIASIDGTTVGTPHRLRTVEPDVAAEQSCFVATAPGGFVTVVHAEYWDDESRVVVSTYSPTTEALQSHVLARHLGRQRLDLSLAVNNAGQAVVAYHTHPHYQDSADVHRIYAATLTTQ